MIWPVFLTVCYFCIVFLVFPPIYAMNDDVMIESILSGSYLRPYPYTYYFSAELGWVISGLYFLLPWIPWLGCFFALCNAVCVFSFAQLAFSRTDVKPMHQFLFAGLSFVGISALCFQSFVLVHYTYVAALLGATGILLLLLKKSGNGRIFAFVLMLFSYLVRENVFFLLAPFVALVFLADFLDKRIEKNKRFYVEAGMFAGGVALAFLLNKCLLSGEEWREYHTYNQTRTQVYDYYGVHEEEEALRFYEARGLSKESLALMRHYDLALFHDGEGNLLGLKTVSEYGSSFKQAADPGALEWVKIYLRRLIKQKDDRPWNFFVMMLYAVIFLFLCHKFVRERSDRTKSIAGTIILIMAFGYRSLAWTYLLYQGRFPQRVTLSLYWMEIAFLIGFLIRLLREKTHTKGFLIFASLLGALFLATAFGNIQQTKDLYEKQAKTNQLDEALMNYVSQRKDQFFLLDLYATVYRTKPVFSSPGREKENYLLLGGWMTRHPLYMEKIDQILPGAENAWDILMKKENAVLILKENAGISKETLENALSVRFIQVDALEEGQEKFYFFTVEKE